MNKKLLIPLLTAVTMAALGVGTTFALFTSKQESKLELKAGTVKVEQETKIVSAVSRYEDSPSYDALVDEKNATFENGGTAKLEDATLTLDKIAPMDKIEMSFDVSNLSNIAIKWRYYVVTEGDLIPALEIKVGDEVFTTEETSENTQYGSWSDVVDPSVTELSVDNLVVTFPSNDNNNDFQDTTGTVTLVVEAVQGNASVHDPVSTPMPKTFTINIGEYAAAHSWEDGFETHEYVYDETGTIYVSVTSSYGSVYDEETKSLCGIDSLDMTNVGLDADVLPNYFIHSGKITLANDTVISSDNFDFAEDGSFSLKSDFVGTVMPTYIRLGSRVPVKAIEYTVYPYIRYACSLGSSPDDYTEGQIITSLPEADYVTATLESPAEVPVHVETVDYGLMSFTTNYFCFVENQVVSVAVPSNFNIISVSASGSSFDMTTGITLNGFTYVPNAFGYVPDEETSSVTIKFNQDAQVSHISVTAVYAE